MARSSPHRTAAFGRLGYDFTQVRFEFGVVLRGAGQALGNTVTLDPEEWNSADQAHLLAHEITHSAQYDQAGLWSVLGRTLVENLTYGAEIRKDHQGATLEARSLRLPSDAHASILLS